LFKLAEIQLKIYSVPLPLVFAYGATGSGKTHTMVGNAETEYGLTYLTVMELYKRLQDLDQEYESDIMISYLEVYNEQVKDLLDESDSDTVLNILETQHGVLIPKLRTHKPKDADHILSLLKYGNSRRSQHPTDQNHESSRSHAVFQVSIKTCSATNFLISLVLILTGSHCHWFLCRFV